MVQLDVEYKHDVQGQSSVNNDITEENLQKNLVPGENRQGSWKQRVKNDESCFEVRPRACGVFSNSPPAALGILGQ